MERESRILEYKRSIGNYNKIAQTVVAFANGDGGQIIVGVDDKTRNITGLSAKEIDDLLERLPVSLADLIYPPIFPQVFEKTIDGKEVLILQVFPGSQKPYFISAAGMEKGVFIRVGSHTRRASGPVLDELRLLRSRTLYDEAPVPECPVKELQTNLLPSTLRTKQALLSLDIIRHDTFSASLHPTRGGVLMLHPSPHRYVPEAVTIVSRMRGDRGRDTIETHEISGSLGEQSDTTIALLEEWLARDHGLRGSRYSPRNAALPLPAVREAINNALFHRQYSIPGAIKAALYADRLEVFSPGHFAGPFIPETLGDGTSYIRNRVIAVLARRLNFIEKRGTGIRLIKDVMADSRLPEPVFQEGAQWFKVTLYFSGHAEFAEHEQPPEKAILTLFETKSEISSADVRSLLKVSKATSVSFLDRLITDKKIVRVGKGPKTRYKISGY
jgi:ATP-dependent DNA helicase RecG